MTPPRATGVDPTGGPPPHAEAGGMKPGAAPDGPGGARPVFLSPLRIHLPVTATVSLAHRISGLLLVLALPAAVLLLAHSLSPGVSRMPALQGAPARAVLLLMAWSLAHHTAAGVRHLLFDAGRGTTYPQARRSAWVVHAIAAAAVLLALGALLAGPSGAP